MGNQCCSQTPNDSNQNQVVTSVNKESTQKPIEQEFSARKKIESFKSPEQESEENHENHNSSDKNVNVFEKNQDEHYPSKAIAVEADSLPQSDNMGIFFCFFFLNTILTNIH